MFNARGLKFFLILIVFLILVLEKIPLRVPVSKWLLSLTPGFSPVQAKPSKISRFNGLPRGGKPLKRLKFGGLIGTGLKPGVNEMGYNILGNALKPAVARKVRETGRRLKWSRATVVPMTINGQVAGRLPNRAFKKNGDGQSVATGAMVARGAVPAVNRVMAGSNPQCPPLAKRGGNELDWLSQ